MLILVWFERSLYPAQVSGQSCPDITGGRGHHGSARAVTGSSGGNGLINGLIFLQVVLGNDNLHQKGNKMTSRFGITILTLLQYTGKTSSSMQQKACFVVLCHHSDKLSSNRRGWPAAPGYL